MSKERYIWWGYVKGMVRGYPAKAAELNEMRTMGMTARYQVTAGGRKPGRSTEMVALRELPAVQQKEFNAVRKALEWISAKPDGELRMKMVRLVYWKQTHRLYAAAREIGISERTAKRWNSELLCAVAKEYGLL